MSIVSVHSYSMYKSAAELEAEGFHELAEATREAQFDPAEHTVTEVLIYAGENPDRIDEIIGDEVKGRRRITLLSQLDRMNGGGK